MTAIFLIILIILVILLYMIICEDIKKYSNIIKKCSNSIKKYFRKRVRKKCKNYWQLFYGKKYKDITYSDIEKCYNDVQVGVEKDISNYKFFVTLFISILVGVYGILYYLYKEFLCYLSNEIFSTIILAIYAIFLYFLKIIVFYGQIIIHKEAHLYILRKELSKHKMILVDKKYKMIDGVIGVTFIVIIHVVASILIFILFDFGLYYIDYYGIVFLFICIISFILFIIYISRISYTSEYSYIYKTKIIKK